MTFEVIVVDFSQIKGLWETRVKKYKDRCKKEEQRVEMSALEKIKQEWSFMLECRHKGVPQSVYLKNGFVDTEVNILERIERNSHIAKNVPTPMKKPETDAFIFELYGEHWEELPDWLQEKIYLKEWHVKRTRIQIIPAYVQMFRELKVLDMFQNKLTCLPPELDPMELGLCHRRCSDPRNYLDHLPCCLNNLKELNVSFNNLNSIPPELGNCANLEKLDLSGNLELVELPFELSNLKKATFVDVSANKFSSIPICVLRMSSLKWLDISNNNLKDLPQDIDRLDQLETLLLQKNKITYLPAGLANISTLRMLVVSGDSLVEIPTALVENPYLKYVKILDNPIDPIIRYDTDDDKEIDKDREQFEKEFMRAYMEDLAERETSPRYTTKVSFSLQI